ncbi:MAG: hypothetical protein JWM11_3058 [Planctomycetaceae bacterium]|nr:hypothetical protein [Planctomycetaceae bacterium]
MQILFVVLALFADVGVEVDETRLAPETVNAVAEAVQTGSIIASRGDCLAVRVYTQSPYTHVGAVVVQDGRAVVYDSMIRIGVRCQPLDEYLESQRPCDIELFHPVKPFTKTQAKNFEKHLTEQVGRPYAIRQYVTGREVKGLHCAEYLTQALIASEHITAANPAKVSPAEILECVTKHELYSTGDTSNLPAVPVPPPPPATTWYGRIWQDTTQCTQGCWFQTRRVVLAK